MIAFVISYSVILRIPMQIGRRRSAIVRVNGLRDSSLVPIFIRTRSKCHGWD